MHLNDILFRDEIRSADYLLKRPNITVGISKKKSNFDQERDKHFTSKKYVPPSHSLSPPHIFSTITFGFEGLLPPLVFFLCVCVPFIANPLLSTSPKENQFPFNLTRLKMDNKMKFPSSQHFYEEGKGKGMVPLVFKASPTPFTNLP